MTDLISVDTQVTTTLDLLRPLITEQQVTVLSIDGCWECRTADPSYDRPIQLNPHVPQFMIMSLINQLASSRNPERVRLNMEGDLLKMLILRFPWFNSFIWLSPGQSLQKIWSNYRLLAISQSFSDRPKYSSDIEIPNDVATSQAGVEGFARSINLIHGAIAGNKSFDEIFKQSLRPVNTVRSNTATIGHYDC